MVENNGNCEKVHRKEERWFKINSRLSRVHTAWSVVWNAVEASEGLVLLKLILSFIWVCRSCELDFLLVILSLKHSELYFLADLELNM